MSPSSTVRRFIEIDGALQAQRKRWSESADVQHAAALALVPLEGAPRDLTRRFRSSAEAIAKAASWRSGLRGGVRHALAPLELRADLGARRFVDAIAATRERFRAVGLRHGAAHEAVAAALLVVESGGRPVSDERARRVARLEGLLRVGHRATAHVSLQPLYVACTSGDGAVEPLARDAHAIYVRLRDAKVSRGSPTFAGAVLLALLGDGRVERRLLDLWRAGASRGLRMCAADVPPLVLLAGADGEPGGALDRALAIRSELRTASRSMPSATLGKQRGFELGAALAALERGADGAHGVATWLVLQSVVAVQTTMMVTTMVAASTATTGAGA